LSNPVYLGAIAHGNKLYPEAHPAIIDKELWDAVQATLVGNCPKHPQTPRLAAPALLQGLLIDDGGSPMGIAHANRRGRRYRYYTSTAAKRGVAPGSLPRIAIGVLDEFLVSRVSPVLNSAWLADLPANQRLREAIHRVVLGAERIEVTLKGASSNAAPAAPGGTCRWVDDAVEVVFPIRLKHRQGAIVLSAPGPADAPAKVDRALVRALCLATSWADRLARGETGSTREIAREQGLCHHYAARLMPLAWLAPDLAQRILDGRQPAALSLGALTECPLPALWEDQRSLFSAFE
jgi:hypothetical protein